MHKIVRVSGKPVARRSSRQTRPAASLRFFSTFKQYRQSRPAAVLSDRLPRRPGKEVRQARYGLFHIVRGMCPAENSVSLYCPPYFIVFVGNKKAAGPFLIPPPVMTVIRLDAVSLVGDMLLRSMFAICEQKSGCESSSRIFLLCKYRTN